MSFLARLTGRKSRLKTWSTVFGIVLAVPLLLLAFRGVEWSQLLKTIWQARFGYLALAFGECTLSYFLRALRWRVILGARKRIALLPVFWATMAGYLGNSFLPARAGELLRSVLVASTARTSKSFVLSTALSEKLMDTVTLVLISSGALLTLQGLPDWVGHTSTLMAMLGIAGLTTIWFAPQLENPLRRLLHRLPVRPQLRWQAVHAMEQFLLGMRAFHHVARAAKFAALTILIWLIDSAAAITVGHSLRLGLTLPAALLLLAALGLSSALPSTPGYLGIYQFVAVTVLGAMSVGKNQALAFILMFQFVSYVVFTLWGGIGIWRLRRGISESEEAEEVGPALVFDS